jgi:hypothetical protein
MVDCNVEQELEHFIFFLQIQKELEHFANLSKPQYLQELGHSILLLQIQKELNNKLKKIIILSIPQNFLIFFKKSLLQIWN